MCRLSIQMRGRVCQEEPRARCQVAAARPSALVRRRRRAQLVPAQPLTYSTPPHIKKELAGGPRPNPQVPPPRQPFIVATECLFKGTFFFFLKRGSVTNEEESVEDEEGWTEGPLKGRRARERTEVCLAPGSPQLRPISYTDLARAFVFVRSSRCFPFSSIPFLLSPSEIGKGAMSFLFAKPPAPPSSSPHPGAPPTNTPIPRLVAHLCLPWLEWSSPALPAHP